MILPELALDAPALFCAAVPVELMLGCFFRTGGAPVGVRRSSGFFSGVLETAGRVVPMVLVRRAVAGAIFGAVAVVEGGRRVAAEAEADTAGRSGGLWRPVAVRVVSRAAVVVSRVVTEGVEREAEARLVGRRAVPVTAAFFGPGPGASLDFVGVGRGEEVLSAAGAGVAAAGVSSDMVEVAGERLDGCRG